MQLFLHKSPRLLRAFYSQFVWNVPTDEKIIYLTFDDGPIPDITEWVLQQLAEYQAKATFFCIGENIQKHPEVLAQVLEQGHSIGNHTFNHLNGWKTNDLIYNQNVRECQAVLPVETNLFRPPYGRIKLSQAKPLLANHRIVMWDVLTGDFERYLSPAHFMPQNMKQLLPSTVLISVPPFFGFPIFKPTQTAKPAFLFIIPTRPPKSLFKPKA